MTSRPPLPQAVRSPRTVLAAVLAAAMAVASPFAAATEDPDADQPRITGSRTAGAPVDASGDDSGAASDVTPAERKRAREAELAAIRRSMEVSQKRQDALKSEIAGLDTDRESLSADLVATGARLRGTELEIQAIEARRGEMLAEEDRIRRSLNERRAVMAEVLMALQRMGRTPPPAILSRPEDALAAIRGSILAGSVLPDIRIEAESLAGDLKSLTDVTAKIEADHATLTQRYAALGEDQTRINLLFAAKRSERQQSEAALATETAKAGALAGKAQTLEGLIRSIETEVAVSAEAADKAKRAAAEPAPPQATAGARLADTSRIAPAMRFRDARGLLQMPVTGEKLTGFGDPDGLGGKAQGLSIGTRPGSPVLSPADGWVVYAGAYRTLGTVLILNAGDGYYVVLSGMDRVNAKLGQFVLAGEPVATMGATRLASLGEVEHTSAQPVLYVEFRKDGTAIDSAPWWAKSNSGEVNG